jgi:hypothetical protein
MERATRRHSSHREPCAPVAVPYTLLLTLAVTVAVLAVTAATWGTW